MSVPKPTDPLEGHCSAIANNVLYVLSPTALQSLPLRSNATWSQQATGESVTGPACVTVVPNGDESSAALYVIGGESNSTSYSGLQRYFFGNNTWETLSPLAANVIQDRTNHSAVYLNDSQSILIYAGSQPSAPSYFSSQTFVMEAVPPFNIESFTSEAPPLNMPILEPWNSSHAIMVGGSASNTDVWTFGASDGWNQFPTNLSQPLDSSSRASVIDGSDGSMVLQVFGFGTSPNTVVDVVLLDANGATSPTGQVVGTNSTTATSSRKRRRLSIGSWPIYNSTNAPTATRTDSSLAVSSNGIVVVAGGNSASPVVLFNQNDDSWIDASTFFNDASAASPSGSGVASATGVGSGTTAATSAATSAAFNEKAYHRKTITALGAILGTLAGLALLFILILVFLSYRRKKAAQREGMATEKGGNDRMSFADRGASFMREAGPGAGTAAAANNNDDLISRAPPGVNSAPGNSHSSLAIMSGRHNGTTRNVTAHAQKASYDSTARLVNDRNNSVVSEPMEMIDIFDGRSTRNEAPPIAGASGAAAAAAATLGADLKAERKRSSGWSKYFATSQATGPNGLSHIPSVYVKQDEHSGESPYATYNTPSQVSRLPSSVMIAPLDIDFNKTVDGQRLSHVASGSPSFFDSREDLANRGSGPEGQKGLIVDPPKSGATSISSYGGNRSATSSFTGEYYNDGETPWTPVSTFKDHVNGDRPTSSLYTNSIYESGTRKYSRGKSPGFFPGAGTTVKSNRPKTSHSAAPTSDWTTPQPPPPAKVADDRTSTLTVFPRGVPSGYYTQTDEDRQNGGAKRLPTNTDMSWLNLGLNNKAQV